MNVISVILDVLSVACGTDVRVLSSTKLLSLRIADLLSELEPKCVKLHFDTTDVREVSLIMFYFANEAPVILASAQSYFHTSF